MQPAALKTPRRTFPDMVWLVRQLKEGKSFNTITEIFILG